MAIRGTAIPDLFLLLPEQRILICRLRKAGVVLKHLVTHIRTHDRRLCADFHRKRSAAERVQNRLLSFFCFLISYCLQAVQLMTSPGHSLDETVTGGRQAVGVDANRDTCGSLQSTYRQVL